MAIGELGLLLEPAVYPVEEELRLTPGFATAQHRQTEEQPVLVQLLKVWHAIHSRALLVTDCYIKESSFQLSNILKSMSSN
jgi:hypothetical protein